MHVPLDGGALRTGQLLVVIVEQCLRKGTTGTDKKVVELQNPAEKEAYAK